MSGEIVCYTIEDVDAMLAYYRPITRRVAGDPLAGGTTYVDYWGGNPAGTLITEPWREDLTATPPIYYAHSYNAILSGFTRKQPLPPGRIHFCDAEFTILTYMAPVEVTVPARTPPYS